MCIFVGYFMVVGFHMFAGKLYLRQLIKSTLNFDLMKSVKDLFILGRVTHKKRERERALKIYCWARLSNLDVYDFSVHTP